MNETWLGCRSVQTFDGAAVACTLTPGHDGPHGCTWDGGHTWDGGELGPDEGIISEAVLRRDYELVSS